MADDWLQIRNWDKWQSYRKDRGQPPWIKIHRQLMRNVDWVGLSATERGELVCIWMLAADRDGLIPSDPETIRKLCYLESSPDIQRFIDTGFLQRISENPTTQQSDDDTDSDGKVYFIRYQGCIKVGFSKNPWARLSSLKTGMPHDPEMIGHIDGTRDQERQIHDCFSEYRKNGEWFEETPEIIQLIQGWLATGKLPDELPTPGSLSTRGQVVTPEKNRGEKIRVEAETSPNGDVCTEPGETPAPSRPPDEPTEFFFECVGKGAKTWALPKSKMDEYLESYPGLDVRSEIRKARQWIRDNPAKRKTTGTGMLRFLTSWLNRAQNSGGNYVSTRPGRSGPQIGDGQRYNPDAEEGVF